jgi:hypothetical protein
MVVADGTMMPIIAWLNHSEPIIAAPNLLPTVYRGVSVYKR